MAEPRWTPGPWRVLFGRDDNTTYPLWVSAAERPHETVLNSRAFAKRASARATANAHLIGAAPDLYAALADLLETISVDTMQNARTALARARGETP